MELVSVTRIGAGLVADALDRGGVERAEIAGARRFAGAARVDRLRPPFLERGIVEKRVRSGVQDLV
jgi:hypothetical protein